MEYLGQIKWEKGYRCRNCGHGHHMPGKKPFSRRCKSCKYDESATSHTLFHKVKFPVEKAFELLFLVSTSRKGVSTKALSEELEMPYETCLNFRRKAQKAMESSQAHPLTGRVDVDETAIGGYDPGSQGRAKGDKKLVSIALELTALGGFGRAYAVKIADYSSQELQKIFDRHISKEASVKTDKWSGYIPLKEAYPKLEQEYSDKGGNFPQLHLHILNLKSWIRGLHHHVNEEYVQRYLDEFHFRFNRRAFRDTIFHKLIERMVNSAPIPHCELLVKAT
jgi:transposase-like protein